MNALGPTSLARLHGVHPKLVAVVRLATTLSSQDFLVNQGLRLLAEEKANVAKGTSRTLNSMHLVQPDGYGHAVDLAAYVDGQIDWGAQHDWPIAAAMQSAAQKLATTLRWGGVWDATLNSLAGSPADAFHA